jgi:thiamine biosynthesis lipoprotein
MHKLPRLFNAFSLILLSALLLACSQNGSDEKAEQHRSLLLFGTIIDITLYDVDQTLADQAFTELDSDFTRWHQNWSPWTDGELAQLNLKLAAGKSFQVDPELRKLIQTGVHLSAISNNLFNPAIGNLVNLWQFHRSEEADIKPPSPAAIAKVVNARPVMADLVIDGNTISSTNPGVQLTLGAYAKGYAIDIALARLRALGIHDAVINAGGDLKVIGKHGRRDWRVGIRHPRRPVMLGWVDARPEEGVFTSGDYERFYMYKGKRMHHIIDPRTGYPSIGLTSVTVIDNDASLADAAATSLMVAGPEHWYATAKAMGIKYAMVVEDNGHIDLNPAMAKRVHFTTDQSANISLSQPL